MKIVKSSSCKNSPKNELIQTLFIWKVGKNFDALGPFLNEDTEWASKVGKTCHGAEAVTKALSAEPRPKSLKIDHVFAHGKTGLAKGRVTLADGKSEIWCDVIEFTSASTKVISKIDSFKKKDLR
jgi:hypothetical protein